MAYRFNPFTGTLDLQISASSVGDITSVGDVASGQAFTGTQGTTLTFFNAGGNATLAYDGTDFDIAIPLTVTIAGAISGLNLVANGNGPHMNLTGDPTVAAPAEGDFWYDDTNDQLNFRHNGVTTDLFTGAPAIDDYRPITYALMGA